MPVEDAQPTPLTRLNASAISGLRRWLPYTPSANVIDDPPRAIMTDVDGTLTIEDVDGESITITTTALTPEGRFSPTKITAMGTATICYLGY